MTAGKIMIASAAGLALVIAASLAYAKSRSGRRGPRRSPRARHSVEMAEFDGAEGDDDDDNDLLRLCATSGPAAHGRR